MLLEECNVLFHQDNVQVDTFISIGIASADIFFATFSAHRLFRVFNLETMKWKLELILFLAAKQFFL